MRSKIWLPVAAHLILVVTSIVASVVVAPRDAPQAPPPPPPPVPVRADPTPPPDLEPLVVDDPHTLTLDEICTPDDTLTVDGYTVRRYYDADRSAWYVTITAPGGRTTELGEEDSEGSFVPRFGTASLLQNGRRQLVVVQSTGGAHCCYQYRIYDLGRQPRLVFDGRKWLIGDGFDDLEFEDLDCDGDLEFAQKTVHFDYEFDLCYVASPQPTIVFAYNASAGQYVPANRRFRTRILRRVPEVIHDIDERERSGEDDPMRDLVDALYVALAYVYAGQEATGFAFLKCHEPYYDADIRGLLRSDPLYRYLYGRRGLAYRNLQRRS